MVRVKNGRLFKEERVLDCFLRNVGVESPNLFFSTNSQEAMKRLSFDDLGRTRRVFCLR